jgi:hypothetical protein
MARTRSISIANGKLHVDGQLVLENLNTTELRVLLHEASQAANLGYDKWLGDTHKNLGYSDIEQCNFILNAIRISYVYDRTGEDYHGGCTREDLIRRAGRKYRGLNAEKLDYYLDNFLIPQGYVDVGEAPSAGLLRRRNKTVYYLDNLEDASYVPRTEMDPGELPLTIEEEKNRAEYEAYLASVKKKYSV